MILYSILTNRKKTDAMLGKKNIFAFVMTVRRKLRSLRNLKANMKFVELIRRIFDVRCGKIKENHVGKCQSISV